MTEPTFKWWEGGRGAMLDQIICSCGWESATFFDGAEFAHSQWKKHVANKHAPSITCAPVGGARE